MTEQDYIEGSRRAHINMLMYCLQALGVDGPEVEKARWIVERQETVAKLRQICESHGDNDWEDNLNLADVIEKHLWKHLLHEPDSWECTCNYKDNIDCPHHIDGKCRFDP